MLADVTQFLPTEATLMDKSFSGTYLALQRGGNLWIGAKDRAGKTTSCFLWGLHLSIGTRWARLDTTCNIQHGCRESSPNKVCFYLSDETVQENKNAHIQPSVIWGARAVFYPTEQFECRGENKEGKHMSLSFSKLHWLLVHVRKSTFICWCFSLFFFIFQGCLLLLVCIYLGVIL